MTFKLLYEVCFCLTVLSLLRGLVCCECVGGATGPLNELQKNLEMWPNGVFSSTVTPSKQYLNGLVVSPKPDLHMHEHENAE